ncbi:MAG TPA: glutamate formimidoyltransferase [Anaerolineales bacterium]|nr:glutamate formimidoyltransferase [Anaerolineales bacterium]
MQTHIVECIANFSDARRPEVIAAIRQAIASVEHVSLLDQHSDNDHNRTVLTFAGPPDKVEEAAFRAIAKAAELINLDEHTGEHPRIGATDVVPFVPITGVSMQDCVEIARRLGQRVGETLGIPVYLYEEAATRPDRQNLENIRRGQYEGLKKEIESNPNRSPDFGPAKLGTAGATVIGARQPLIAYNVYLSSDDVGIAKKIAKSVRHSSGGLRYVKGLGMLVEGRAQVSMNLTNFRSTPVALVVEMIRREAVRYGTSIHHSELVGLIPQEALVEAARYYLQLDDFEPDQILEYRLAAAQAKEQEEMQTQSTEKSSYDFLNQLADGTPAPGGGSASAYSGAAGAALVSMVARLTIGKKKYADVEDSMNSILDEAEALRQALTQGIDEDAAAFEEVMNAYRLPKDTDEQKAARQQAIEDAMTHATQVPLEAARKSVQVLTLAEKVINAGNLNAISDGAAGSAMAIAALTGAGYNVRINAITLADQNVAQAFLQEISELEQQAKEIETRIRKTLIERGGFPLV